MLGKRETPFIREGDNIVFLVGPPRGGTTLMQSFLSREFGFKTIPETHYFNKIIPKLGRKFSDPEKKIYNKGCSIIKEELYKNSGIIVNKKDLEGLSSREVFIHLFGGEDSKFFLEKTPLHSTSIDLIWKYFPEAKVVQIIRDPYSCIASMSAIRPVNFCDTRISYIHSIRQFSLYWEMGCTPDGKTKNAKNFYRVYYEDFIENPEKLKSDLARFFCIPNTNIKRENNNFYNLNFNPWQKLNRHSPKKDRKYAGLNSLKEEEIFLVWFYNKNLIKKMNYPFPAIKIPAWRKTLYLLLDNTKYLIWKLKIESLIRKLSCS
ncbi:sulfotransferase family protein [Thiohalorhabdus sp. Cl-TMA]|uniref:Sulfotransferase n=1 Tax=Thiohalorhabdus methylotrophus TaxID=3242694 RepID=A0ABV4U2F3_9GAMM